MGELIDSGLDLVIVAAFLVALGMTHVAGVLVVGVLKFIDVGIGPYHPFHGIANKAENAVSAAFNSAEQALEAQIARFMHGLSDSLELIVGVPLLLAVALSDLLKYLWHTAISAFVGSIVGPVRTIASSALTKVAALEGTVADDLTRAERYADNAASGAVSDSEAFARKWIDNAVSALNAAVASALATAEGYTDKAFGRLQSLEDAAVDHAVALAADAKNAGIAAAASALTTAEGYTDAARGAALAAAAGALTTAESYTDAAKRVALDAAGGALTTAEQYADVAANAAQAGAEAAAAQADGVVSAALGEVRSVAIDVQHDLGTIEGQYGAIGLAALIASVPAIATLVNAIATEAGLENSSCRAKVKGICGTDPLAWGSLLAGIAAIGVGFDLSDIVKAAVALLGDADELLAKVGQIAEDEIDAVGKVIGEAALAIAA